MAESCGERGEGVRRRGGGGSKGEEEGWTKTLWGVEAGVGG